MEIIQAQAMDLTQDRAMFQKIFGNIVQDLMSHPDHCEIVESNLWLKKVLLYNVPFGKMFRGLSVVNAYRHFATNVIKNGDYFDKNLEKACILGWCVEILHASFLVADDIMDNSDNRRGRPCWYRVEGIGTNAVNDAYLLESVVFYIIRKYFEGEKFYSHLLDLIHDSVLKTTLGQSLDLLSHDLLIHDNFDNFTINRYKMIAKYKTSFYSFYLPISLAATMCELQNEKLLSQLRDLLLQIGYLYQVQDDILDCFGNSNITGKIGGMDIADGKCTWLIVQALSLCDQDQRQQLRGFYGKGGEDKETIVKVKEIYEELKLYEHYKEYEVNCVNDILKLMSELNDKKLELFLQQFFIPFIHNRQK